MLVFLALVLGGAPSLAENVRKPTFALVTTTLGLVFPVETLAPAGSAKLGAEVQGLSVTETATGTRIELPADILFDFDKADIRLGAEPVLRQAADLLRQRASGQVRIEGHTDAKGTPTYNQKLSERRAAAVEQWLVKHEGLADVRFLVVGYGAQRSVAPNMRPDGSDNPEGRQKNRRVEIVFARQ
jgi:outer membrane protein OmpA-like peptidoglycan-associated protein